LFRATSRSRAFDNTWSSGGGDLSVVGPLSIEVLSFIELILHEVEISSALHLSFFFKGMSLFSQMYIGWLSLSHSVGIRLKYIFVTGPLVQVIKSRLHKFMILIGLKSLIFNQVQVKVMASFVGHGFVCYFLDEWSTCLTPICQRKTSTIHQSIDDKSLLQD
jgi:hypothetical protein